MYVLLTFLETNGVPIHPTVDDVPAEESDIQKYVQKMHRKR